MGKLGSAEAWATRKNLKVFAQLWAVKDDKSSFLVSYRLNTPVNTAKVAHSSPRTDACNRCWFVYFAWSQPSA